MRRFFSTIWTAISSFLGLIAALSNFLMIVVLLAILELAVWIGLSMVQLTGGGSAKLMQEIGPILCVSLAFGFVLLAVVSMRMRIFVAALSFATAAMYQVDLKLRGHFSLLSYVVDLNARDALFWFLMGFGIICLLSRLMTNPSNKQSSEKK